MIKDIFEGLDFEPQDVFGEYELEDVAETLADNNVNSWDKKSAMKAVDSALEDGLLHDKWLYISTWYAHSKLSDELSYYDRSSFAGLITSLITGWYGGYGTDMYEKERIINNRAIFMLQRLKESGVSALGAARIMKELLVDLYKTVEVEEEK